MMDFEPRCESRTASHTLHTQIEAYTDLENLLSSPPGVPLVVSSGGGVMGVGWV